MKKVRRSLSRYKLVWVILLCAVALLFLSAATTHAAPQNSCGGYHFVQRGETLYSISKWYGVSIQAMMRANPGIRNPNRIYAGTWLYIPCGSGGPGTGGPCRNVHYVAWGQTLGEIARHYRVSPYAIAQANGISNLDLIYAGQSLCIP
jgi:LysM repeat protein